MKTVPRHRDSSFYPYPGSGGGEQGGSWTVKCLSAHSRAAESWHAPPAKGSTIFPNPSKGLSEGVYEHRGPFLIQNTTSYKGKMNI